MSFLRDGWHPTGDKEIHRATWKKDLKNIASRKDEQAIRAKDHVSAPLSSLKDPDSFGPPPKHTAYYGPDGQSPTTTTPTTKPKKTITPSAPTGASAGLGAAVPRVAPRVQPSAQQEQEEKPAGPYQVNTTGLKTDNLPKPPGRRDVPTTPVSSSSPVSRPVPSLPPRSATGGPPPILPPRQSETPNQYTPAAPPSYGEATSQSPLSVNTEAVNRLGRAGVSVPGFGIGAGNASSPQSASTKSQVNELQQRFARMNTGAGSDASQHITGALAQRQSPASASPSTSTPISPAAGMQAAAALVGLKKKPPPPPAKRAGLTEPSEHADTSVPPPIPMSSKPRPG